MDIILPILSGVFQGIIDVLAYVWWLVLPLILIFILLDLHLNYIKDNYIKNIKWKTLELRIPKENLKTPKAMEQIFSAVHTIHTKKIKGFDKYIKGKVAPWISFEIVGHGGGIYFFIRIPEDLKNLVESAIFSQYSSAEISEVEDYISIYPSVLPNDIYDIWGTDYILAKDDPYPVKTYAYFEEKEEEKRIDPLSIITEAMARLKEDETIWIQFLIRSTEEAIDSYKNKGVEVINKMMGREKKSEKGGLGSEIYTFVRNLIFAPAEPPVWGTEKKEEAKRGSELTSGEKDIIKAIENKLSKLAFETVIRFVYIDKKDAFTRLNISAINGALKQFNTENLNALKPNKDATTSVSGLRAELFKSYKQKAEHKRKKKIYDDYKKRIMAPKASVFSIEELATMYHVPTTVVEAPRLRRLEAKKGEPPAELPIG